MSSCVIRWVLLGVALCWLVAMFDMTATLDPQYGLPSLGYDLSTLLCRGLVLAGMAIGGVRAVRIGLRAQRAWRRRSVQ